MESIINHIHDRISMVILLADVQIYQRIEVRWTLCLHRLTPPTDGMHKYEFFCYLVVLVGKIKPFWCTVVSLNDISLIKLQF